jgi:phosphatidylserine decarboxylase
MIRDQAYMTLLRVLPKSALSSALGWATRAPLPTVVHHAAIRAFCRSWGVALGEADGVVEDFPTFAQFFTRRLKEGARTIDPEPSAIVSPVDGRISQLGLVDAGRCLQAKGIWYSVEKLLGDARAALRFEGGHYAAIYLSPKDYHRFHAPVAGRITGYTYLPGEFWPVNPMSVRSREALFAVNERLVTHLDTDAGAVALVAVGATCVARIHASYDSVVTHTGQARQTKHYERPLAVEKGGEIGMFEMGSTVVVLFERGRIAWNPQLVAGAPVRLGERIGVKA